MHTRLDVTLTQGTLVDSWLGSWLIAAATDRQSVRVEVLGRGDDWITIGLQTVDGEQGGGIVYADARGIVQVLTALDPKTGEPKARSRNQLAAALDLAIASCHRRRVASKLFDNLWTLAPFALSLLPFAWLFGKTADWVWVLYSLTSLLLLAVIVPTVTRD